jgi:hypothetical protein
MRDNKGQKAISNRVSDDLMVLKLEFALQLLRRPVEAQTTGSYT